MGSKTNAGILDVVKECDNFSPGALTLQRGETYVFKVLGCQAPLGYIPRQVVDKIHWSESWAIDHSDRTVTLTTPVTATTELRSEILEQTLQATRKSATISLLDNWRQETFPVYGPGGEILLNIERCASALFGIVTYGVQLICYAKSEEGPRLWIATRSEKKQTYPGMLDTTAAGGLASGTRPIDALISEAQEEASLPAEMVRMKAKPMRPLSYFHIRGNKAGGESGLFQPEVEYTYEMELDPSWTPTPRDTEVECFRLLTIEQVLDALKNGLFKPNSAVVIVEFLIQYGILNRENEPDYEEILAHLHRSLDFPVLIQKSL